MGYSPWGCKESDMTERLSTIFFRKEQIPTFFFYTRNQFHGRQFSHRLEGRDGFRMI